MKPIVESLAEYKRQIIDIEEDPEASSKYGVSSLPTLLVLSHDGIELSRWTGTMPRHKLVSWIDSSGDAASAAE